MHPRLCCDNVFRVSETTEWRPARRELAEGVQLLKSCAGAEFKTRLKIVEALQATPKAKANQIAREANTRTSVVTALLGRWETHGIGSLTERGRPREFIKQNEELLRETLRLRSPKTMASVNQVVKDVFGIKNKLDPRTVRKYLGRIGYAVPRKGYRPEKLHPSWNEANIAKVANGDQKLRNKLAAILRACANPGLTLREAAADGQERLVAFSTLRADLKGINSKTTLENFVDSRTDGLILERRNLLPAFNEWADGFYKENGRVPKMQEAADHVLNSFGIVMDPKTAFSYLDDWMKVKNIPRREYNRINDD